MNEHQAKNAKSESSVNDSENSKCIEVTDIYGRASLVWAGNEDNPDYKLVVINAANQGFQSKINTVTGSYVITQLSQKVIENNDRFLNEILDDIQEELHGNGKQLMVKTFNNKTEFIKFRKCAQLHRSDGDNLLGIDKLNNSCIEMEGMYS